MSLLVPGDRVSIAYDEFGHYMEHLWECPCGSWQLHVSPAALVLGKAVLVTPEGAEPLERMNLHEIEIAQHDAMWEHEASCEILQHAALQAGLPRPMDLDPFTRDPRSTAVNTGEERTPTRRRRK